jgi:hypothetical protein
MFGRAKRLLRPDYGGAAAPPCRSRWVANVEKLPRVYMES